MIRAPAPLTLVRDGGAPPRASRAAPDVGVTSLLLGVSLVPIVGELGGVGRWDAGSVGLATALAMLTGSALWREILDARRAR